MVEVVYNDFSTCTKLFDRACTTRLFITCTAFLLLSIVQTLLLILLDRNPLIILIALAATLAAIGAPTREYSPNLLLYSC